jgi:large subunit ribosomal protein L9
MDVILLKDVEKVGLKGDVVTVARGYARNYLLPRRLAEPATPGRLAELERHQQLRARHEAQTVEQAQDTAKALEGVELRFDRKAGPTGSLFGSVTATDISDELWNGRRIRIDRRKIDLPDALKRIGRYDIPLELFTDVSVDVRVLVVPEGGELPPEEELQAAEEAEAAAAEEAATEERAPGEESPSAEEPAAEALAAEETGAEASADETLAEPPAEEPEAVPAAEAAVEEPEEAPAETA